MQTGLIDMWEKASNLIKNELTEISYKTWIKTIEPLYWDSGSITLAVPSTFCKGILEVRYEGLIKKSILNITSKEYLISFITEKESESIVKSKNTDLLQPQISFNKEYTFDNFIVGNSNKFAYNAALELSKCLSKVYNPLFIYSNHGLGKTHLLQAIGNYVSNIDQSVKIQYITIEKFVNEFVVAIKDDKMDNFIHRLTSVDVLLVDDIQFICGMDRTQEEFFRIMRELYLKEKQVVIAGTKAPKDILYLDGNFSSIIDIGLTVEIGLPEIETKCDILKKYASIEDNIISEDVIMLIAKRTDNIRELKAFYNRIVAYSLIMEKPLSIEMIKDEVATVNC